MVVGGPRRAPLALQFSAHETLSTIGPRRHPAGDALPARLPRLPGRPAALEWERLLVGAAYVSAIGLQLLKLTLGLFPNRLDFWPHRRRPRAERIQLLSISAMRLAGIAVLLVRRAVPDGRAGARWVCWSTRSRSASAMTPRCSSSAPSRRAGTAFRPVQRQAARDRHLTSGLPDRRSSTRPGSPAVGELLREMRAIRRSASSATRCQGARDPSLTLAYWLPHYEGYDLDGQPVELPPGDGVP